MNSFERGIEDSKKMSDFERDLKAVLKKHDAEIYPDGGILVLTYREEGRLVELAIEHIDYAGICEL